MSDGGNYDFSDTDSLADILPRFQKRGAPGEVGERFKVITNSFHVAGPERAQLLFFDVTIPETSDDTASKSSGSDGAPRAPPPNRQVRRQLNRRIVTQIVEVLQRESGWPKVPRYQNDEEKLPLYAYDEEKTLVIVNPPGPLAMDVRDKKLIVVPLQVGRNYDGTLVTQEFHVTVTHTKKLSIVGADFILDRKEQSREATRSIIEKLQALNLIVREAIMDTRLAQAHMNAGPGKQGPPKVVVSLGDKVFANVQVENFRDEAGEWRSIWPGFTAALRVTRSGLVLMADQTFSVFFTENFLHHAVAGVLRVRKDQLTNYELDWNQMKGAYMNLAAVFRSKSVEFQAFDGEEVVDGVIIGFRGPAYSTPAEKPANIPRDKSQQADYFQSLPKVEDEYRKHGIDLEFPRLPVVEIRSGPRIFRVPVEKVFLLPGQRYQKPLSAAEQSTFIRAVGKSPDKRIGNIDRFLEFTQVREHPLLRAIGLGIDPTFINIDARIMPQPAIEYSNRANEPEVVTPRDGTWVTPRNAVYKIPEKLGKFLVFIFPDRRGSPCMPDQPIRNFLTELSREATNRGMQMDSCVRVVQMTNDRLDKQMLDQIQQVNPKFVFGIFEKGSDRSYAAFKAVMDNQEGIPSQGLLNQTVARNPRGCVENVMQKINIKCGGVNNMLSSPTFSNLKLLKDVFMVVGISLSHGSTKSTTARPSYASFVASMDSDFSVWHTETKVISSNEAILTDFSDEMGRLLDAFKEQTEVFPQTVIIYRDGVTRTHENKLLNHDLRCIKAAFVKRGLQDSVKLVFVVVNKMHRTRFFRMPNVDNMGAPRYALENIPAGLVVDSQIVDPYNDDFYLASHRGALGTSRPIRYHILLNEVQDTRADDIQRLTMCLCYIYQRCTIGVSIPAPLYYANLAAARCSVLADDMVKKLDQEAAQRAPADSGSGGRGGRGGFRGGRGGRRATFSMDDRNAVARLSAAISLHPKLKELKRLSYI